MAYSYYAVVTNRKGNVQELMKAHAKRGTSERRICLFTNEFQALSHLPMGEFFANWVYLLCAQLAYNLSLWIRDLGIAKTRQKETHQKDTALYRTGYILSY